MSAHMTEDLQDLFDNAPCGYVSLLPGGRIFKVNATLSGWTGHAPQELTGVRFHDLLTIAGRIYYETHFAPLLRIQGFFNEVALDLRTKDEGRIPVLVNAVERRGPDGELLFIRLTLFNATDRRRYERELLAARVAAENVTAQQREVNATLEARISDAVARQLHSEEALRQSQKMEAIGQLTGGVAHDFNNLLTVIIGGLDTIARQMRGLPESPQVERIRRARSMAQQGAQRAVALTTRLLAFSRRQTLAPRSIDPNAVVSGIADLLQRTLGETIAFETLAAAGVQRAFADPAELENVLLNLAVNARDAMPLGGRLTIETCNAPLDDAYTATLTEPVASGQYVLITVADTGHGMDDGTLARVFEPFFTTKEVGKGTGLGLSQVYGFVRQSGGHIRIDSKVGAGTTVKLYLPRADETAATQPEAAAALHVRSDAGGGETILVVEDDAELRAFSASVLIELGYTVLEARSGPAALDLLQANADIALLFTDVVLPDGMNGRSLAEEASRRRPGLKILFTTGYARDALTHQGRLETGVHLIGKPFTFSDLSAKIRALLDAEVRLLK